MNRRSIVGGALVACWAGAAGGTGGHETPPMKRGPQPADLDKADFHPSALTLFVIRHAEKPDDPALGPGLTSRGEAHKHSLVLRGWQRAGAWATLFGSECHRADYPTPDIVFAANPNARPTEDSLVSRRPYETIEPLCQKIGSGPIVDFGIGDELAMLNAACEKRGVVLICWEHNRIGDAILPELARSQRIPGLPTKWDDARFDVALRFDRPRSDAPWSFRQLFPRLLAGDSNIPL
ncbi:hypothetical protein AMST5_03222 [freshwater sediment metagenome]|uniref:Histidine phosphatase family protein n=1 Tax=freshwater sediment metagenome TaxID=556182 RepID=A0AA48M474_9ZZZZ